MSDGDKETPPGDDSNGLKGEQIINKTSMESNSREGSPDPSKKKSRRKPTVTRKIEAEEEQLEALDAENSFDMDDDMPPADKTSKMDGVDDMETNKLLVNGNGKTTSVEENNEEKSDKKAEDFVIPEGTVIVEPEPVEDSKQKEFKGPEWKATKRLSRSAALGIVQCTACNKQINNNNPGSAKRHPVLKVLICKRCYTWYASAEIEQDSDGMDEQCRWCGDGGNLICCDFCHNAFCKGCIKKNLGRKELSDIIDAGDDDKWHCYVCDPKPLANLIGDCTATIEAIDNEQKKKEPSKKPTVTHTSKMKESVSKPSKSTPVAKKSTTQGGKALAKAAVENTILKGPEGSIVLPPGAIPVKTVLNSSGNQVIVLQQPISHSVKKPKSTESKKSVSMSSFAAANKEQLRIIGEAVKNVSQAQANRMKSQGGIINIKNPVHQNIQRKTGNRAPVVRYEWEAPINEYNVAQSLDRTLAVTESLRMVMVSLKDDMKKANQQPVTQCLEKKRIVAAKLKRAMGAFKKQVQDIELFCKSTFKTVKLSSPQQEKQTSKSHPFPVSMLKNKTSSSQVKLSPKSKKTVEVIELSSSDEETEKNNSSKASDGNKKSPDTKEDLDNKEKKGFSLKIKFGGESSLGADKRKRRHSSEADKSGSEIEEEANNKGESSKSKVSEPSEKKTKLEDEKPKVETAKMNNSSDDEPLSSRIAQKRALLDKESSNHESSHTSKDNKEVVDTEESSTAIDKSSKDHVKVNDSKETRIDGSDLIETMDTEEANEASLKSVENSKSPESTSVPDQESESDTEVNENPDAKVEQYPEAKVIAAEETTGENMSEKDIANKENKDNENSESDSEVVELSTGQMEACTEKPPSDSESKSSEHLQACESDDVSGVDYDIESLLDNKKESGDNVNSPVNDDFSSKNMEVEQSDSYKDGKNSPNKKDTEKKIQENDEEELDTSFGGLKFEPLFVPGENNCSDEETTPIEKPIRKSSKRDKSKHNISVTKGTTRSRNDIEAQRELHKELLEDDSSSSSGVDDKQEDMRSSKAEESSSDDSSDEDSSKKDDENDGEYKPGNVKKKVKKSGPKHLKGKQKDPEKNNIKKHKRKRKSAVKNRNSDVSGENKVKRNKSDETSDSESDGSKDRTKKHKRKVHQKKGEGNNEQKFSSSADDNCAKTKKNGTSENKNKPTSDQEVDKSKQVKSSPNKSSANSKNSKESKSLVKKSKTAKTSDSNSDLNSGKDVKKHKHSKKSVRNHSKRKEKDSTNDSKMSESSNYDSELERDIEKLAHAPKLSKKKSKKEKSEETIEVLESKPDKNSATVKTSHKQRDKHDPLAELGSSEDNSSDDIDEALEEEKEKLNLQEAGKKALKALEAGLGYDDDEDDDDNESNDNMDVESKENKNDNARKALLADDSSGSDSLDSDVEAILAKKAEKDNGSKKTSKNSSAKTSEDEANASDLPSVCESQDSKSSRSKKKYDRLLDARLSNSDDSEIISKSKNKDESEESDEEERDVKEKFTDEERAKDEDYVDNLSDVSSDFDLLPKKKLINKKNKKSSTSESDTDSETEKKSKKNEKGKKRKRIKVASDSSQSDGSKGPSGEEGECKSGKKKKIRKLIKDNKLSQDTKSAAKAEEERRERIKERQKLYNQVEEEDVNSPTKAKITTKLVLEIDEDKEPVIEVHPKLIRKLKPHQVEAVKFLWDCCVESLDRAKKENGAGCILAHCMGLGKTLSVITFTHTLMTNAEHTKIEKALVVCPLNTVLNWQNEWTKWLDKKDQLDVYELSSVKDNAYRANLLEEWHNDGGIMIIGYEMFRNLSTLRNIRKAKQKKIFTKTLVDPGPDIVICDEGHVLRNDTTALSKAMNNIKTKRRVCLTGTPLQNNLAEYHCMIDFVKPKLLGTRKEFMNRFVNPIKNGQCSDSTSHDVKLMKKRAHILHETLAGCVQRKDYSALTKFLPPKHEYVISVRLSEVQIELYEKYLNRVGHGPLDGEKLRSAQLFSDYQALMRIWTHPWVLKLQEIREENKRMMEDSDSLIDDESSMDSFIDDSDASDTPSEESVQSISSDDSDGSYKKNTRSSRRENGNPKKKEVVKKWKSSSRGGEGPSRSNTPQVEENGVSAKIGEWWAEHLSEEDRYNIEISGKISLLAEILRLSEAIGDKVLVFSQSLLSLDLIEDFLAHWDRPIEDESEKPVAGTMGWSKGVDYFRMDGSTSAQFRKSNADVFNEADNVRARLFLISTRAGCLGTNLVGANRVIIFDASWNPSHDTQSIFRVYRFGQTKPVYIYRFLAQGTMEEKIYERQVIKQSLSQRVVDEHQVERHFSTADLSELYNFKPEKMGDKPEDEYIHILPKDLMLADLLTEQKMWIVKYHEHDSLLENKVDEDLTEEERKAAWEEYELEKKQGYRMRPVMAQNTNQLYQQYHLQQSMYGQQGASNLMYQQQLAKPPEYGVQQIEQLARAIYAANPGLNQTDLQKHVQTYIQHQQIQFYQRQREQIKQQETWFRQQQQNKAQGDGSAGSLLRNLMASQRPPAPSNIKKT